LNAIDFVDSKYSAYPIRTEKNPTNAVMISSINDFIIFEFRSRSFLRQQVRRMVKSFKNKSKDEFFDKL